MKIPHVFAYPQPIGTPTELAWISARPMMAFKELGSDRYEKWKRATAQIRKRKARKQ